MIDVKAWLEMLATRRSMLAAQPGCINLSAAYFEDTEILLVAIARLQAENARLDALINTPEVHDFAKAVQLEAAHQRERWGVEADQAKSPADWFWLIGYLAGKAAHTPLGKDFAAAPEVPFAQFIHEKLLHRIVTIAAAAANWHFYTQRRFTSREEPECDRSAQITEARA